MLGMGVASAFSKIYSARGVTKTFFFFIAVNRDSIVVSY